MFQLNYLKKKKYDFSLIFSILLILLLPSFIFVSLQTSSLAVGVLISTIIIIIINFRELINLRINYLFLLLFMGISFILYFIGLYSFFILQNTKPILSIVIIAVIFTALLLAKKLSALEFETISNSFLIVIFTLLILGYIKLFFVPVCCHYALHEKAVFPFSEESHYSLALGILIVSYAIIGKIRWLLMINISLLILALSFPNLTLLVFFVLTTFTILLRLNKYYFYTLLIFIPILLFLVNMLFLSSSEYFSSRLSFEDTENLTTLVFLQGWDLAYINFMETDGIGIGYQMLGSESTFSSSFTQQILERYSKEFNISDGGFLAAKMIAEFGIIGVLLLLLYFYKIIGYIFRVNQFWQQNFHYSDNKRLDEEKKSLMLSGLLLGFFVELFLRGYGYFSPGVFLVFVSIFYTSINKKRF